MQYNAKLFEFTRETLLLDKAMKDQDCGNKLACKLRANEESGETSS